MKQFFKKTFLLLLPFLAMFAFPLLVQIKSGELMPLSTVIKKQLSGQTHIIYGPAYSNQNTYYKLTIIQQTGPEILALGNSKILPIRSEFFINPKTFYNAGGTLSAMNQYRYFLDKLPKAPKILIFTLEPTYFVPNYKPNNAAIINSLEPKPALNEGLNIFINNWINVYSDYFQKKFTLKQLFAKTPGIETIGLNAVINGKGERADGSYDYSERPADAQPDIDYTVNFINHNGGTANFSSDFSELALKQLGEFLQYCKQRDIYVIGYIPPLPHAVFEAYKKNPDYAYMFLTQQKTQNLFTKYGFGTFNFLDLASLGATDSEAVDGYHVSEKANLRLLIQMAEQDPVLKKTVNLDWLKKILLESKNKTNVFE